MIETRDLTMVDGPAGACDAMLRGLRPAGPVHTAVFADGRLTVYRDGAPAPADDPWRLALEDSLHEADRVMVRAVSPLHPFDDDEWVYDGGERLRTWRLDPRATGHRAPFHAGDLVVATPGYWGIHVVREVDRGPDGGMLRLLVKRADPVVDRDAF